MRSKAYNKIFSKRDLEIYESRVLLKKTYADLGKIYGISRARVRQIVEKVKKVDSIRKHRKSWISALSGIIKDPDGIGEIQETWTAEEQYAELEWEKHGKSVQSISGSGSDVRGNYFRFQKRNDAIC